MEPKGEVIELLKQGKRETEVNKFVTQVAKCAGPAFAFDTEKLAQLNN